MIEDESRAVEAFFHALSRRISVEGEHRLRATNYRDAEGYIEAELKEDGTISIEMRAKLASESFVSDCELIQPFCELYAAFKDKLKFGDKKTASSQRLRYADGHWLNIDLLMHLYDQWSKALKSTVISTAEVAADHFYIQLSIDGCLIFIQPSGDDVYCNESVKKRALGIASAVFRDWPVIKSVRISFLLPGDLTDRGRARITHIQRGHLDMPSNTSSNAPCDARFEICPDVAALETALNAANIVPDPGNIYAFLRHPGQIDVTILTVEDPASAHQELKKLAFPIARCLMAQPIDFHQINLRFGQLGQTSFRWGTTISYQQLVLLEQDIDSRELFVDSISIGKAVFYSCKRIYPSESTKA